MPELGKYAPYILSAFALSVIAFAWMIGDSLLRARSWRRKAEAARKS